MPTVKLQAEKVILKGGKVSCSCCDDCCMYPAAGLGDTYTADDLPDEIWVQSSIGNIVLSVDRDAAIDGGKRKFYSGSIDGDEVAVFWDDVNNPDPPVWSGTPEVGVVGDCLIDGDGNLTPENDLVEDPFADCYEITVDARSVQVTRISLCVWTGLDNCGQLWKLHYGGVDDKWNVNAYQEGGGDPCPGSLYSTFTKTGDQNTPVGSYGGPSTCSVAECS
jgi:hypothetical protein